MARRKFSNWIEAYKKLLLQNGVENEQSIKTIDEKSFKETFFDQGDTVQEAFETEMYYLSQN